MARIGLRRTQVCPSLSHQFPSFSPFHFILVSFQVLSCFAGVLRFVGSSLGGAVSVHMVWKKLLTPMCLCVIDVVEGSAMDAIKVMRTYLSTRPKKFTSIEDAIRWYSMHSRTVRNWESAKISLPPLLAQKYDGRGEWIWRTDLMKTQPFWEGSAILQVSSLISHFRFGRLV